MFSSERIDYQKTQAFSRIVSAYLDGEKELKPFFSHAPTTEGIGDAIAQRKKFYTNRELLVRVLTEQYAVTGADTAVLENINALQHENTFTVTTAHQPNLFTGPLYFIYKILHAIKLARRFNEGFPGHRFVPVYYMGSEDADFAELNHTYVNGKKIEWKKDQGGAVGRMPVDKTLIQLIDELEGQLGVEKFGADVIGLLRDCYASGKDIQTATFRMVNQLYGRYGLVVLIPDNAALKQSMLRVFEDDIFQNTPSAIVAKTSEKLEAHYSVQANPREINLFYLKDNIRERIIRQDGSFVVNNTAISFSAAELSVELHRHPDRFSPNVILRGLYQETLLPNIAFVGGGGELAYWLQLKDVFEHYGVPYPVLVLRNSFLLVESKWKARIERMGLVLQELFESEDALMKKIVQRQSERQTSLNGNFEKAETLYNEIGRQATGIDPTLEKHVAAIKTRSLKCLRELEKKMLRAEKRRFIEQEVQLKKIKDALFPNNGLQERVENFSGFYAKWGPGFLEELLRHSLTLEQQFTILTEES